MNRTEKLAGLVHPLQQEGIEIGALDRPLFSGPGTRLRIADHLSSDQLKRKYDGITAIDLERIAHVDYVLGERSLPEVVGPEKHFDYVIASHVIEHVPNFVGFLSEVSSILNPGGLLCLAIPDKRYSFDYTRRTTTLADVIEAYLLDYTRPSPRQVFDHFSNHVHLDLKDAWSGIPAEQLPKTHSLEESMMHTRTSLTGIYHDVHSQVFTPGSFCEILKGLMNLELTDFEIAQFHETEQMEFEFFVTLRRSQCTDVHKRKYQQLVSLPKLMPTEDYRTTASEFDPTVF